MEIVVKNKIKQKKKNCTKLDIKLSTREFYEKDNQNQPDCWITILDAKYKTKSVQRREEMGSKTRIKK